MKIFIKSKYLVFPVNTYASSKVLEFKDGNEVVYTLNIKLDNLHQDFCAYIDVSRYMGKELELSLSPEMKINYREADSIDLDGLYKEDYRPQVHFTTKNGCINDPNGVIYLDGFYHLFYQHNPCENNWENMHWGHAVSNDMIHWEEKDIALFPDKTGTMYSGSAVIDKDNVLGLHQGDIPTAVIFYTATKPFSQYMAYSTDGFKTLHKYGDAVIPHIADKNRDPSVIYCKELNKYIMALYLTGDIYGLLTSEDLLHWELIQEINMEGDNECPDIFPINDQHGKRHWVLMGAHDRYVIGEFKDNKFNIVQKIRSLQYGESAYAGQTVSNMPDGRTVRFYWEGWNLEIPRINGQMGIPLELNLIEKEGVYYLCCCPVREFNKLFKEHTVLEKIKTTIHHNLDCGPYLIKIDADALKDNTIEILLFGRKIVCNGKDNTVTLGKRTMPINVIGTKTDITIIVDKCSFEIYTDNGTSFMGVAAKHTFCDYNVPFIEISADNDFTINKLELYSLETIWKTN